jgi:thioredoxin-like negative regulator of GroEL
MAFVLVNIVENEEWNVNTGVVQTQYHRASLLVRHRGKALIESALTHLSFPVRWTWSMMHLSNRTSRDQPLPNLISGFDLFGFLDPKRSRYRRTLACC